MWPFSKRRAPSQEPHLVFKNNDSFFEAQCMYGDTIIEENKAIVAQVLDAKRHGLSEQPVLTLDDGRQFGLIRIASEDGGFPSPSQTLSPRKKPLFPGDLVFWVPERYEAKLAEGGPDKRAGWVGFIVAKIAPETPFRIIERYD